MQVQRFLILSMLAGRSLSNVMAAADVESDCRAIAQSIRAVTILPDVPTCDTVEGSTIANKDRRSEMLLLL